MDNDLMARRLRPPSEPLTSIPAPAPVAPAPVPARAAPTAQVEEFAAPAPEMEPDAFFASEAPVAGEMPAPADLGSPWLPSPEATETPEAVDAADAAPWTTAAPEDAPWDRPADYDQPTDTAVAEQAAFGEPAWDRPGSDNWTDRDPLDGLFASMDDEPEDDGQDAPWATPAGATTAVAGHEPVVEAVAEAVAVEAVAVDEPAAEADFDDAYAPVLGDVTTPMHPWLETNGHDSSRNGAVAWEPAVAAVDVAEPMEFVAEPAEAVAEPAEAVAEPMDAVAEPAEAMPETESMPEWHEPDAALFGTPDADATASDWDTPTEASGDAAADAVEPADFAERGLGPTPPDELFAAGAVAAEDEVETEAEVEAEADSEEANAEAWSAAPEPWFDESESTAYNTEPDLSVPDAELEAAPAPEPVVTTVTIPDGRQMPLVLRIELVVDDGQLRIVGPVEAEVERVTYHPAPEEPQAPEPVLVEPPVAAATASAHEAEFTPELDAAPAPEAEFTPEVESAPVAESAQDAEPEPESTDESPADGPIPAPTAGPPPWALAAASTATADAASSPTLLPPWGPPLAPRPGPAQQPQMFAPAVAGAVAPAAEPAFAPPTSVVAGQPVAAAAVAAATASTVATQDQGDLWFLSTEPAATEEAVVEDAEPQTGPSSAMTAGVTVGMAIVVIILALLFIQLMTSILR